MDRSIQKPHLSVSQILMYIRCPLQYYFRYIMNLKVPPKAALAFGRSMHTTLELNYKQKVESHDDLAEDIMCDSFVTDWDKFSPIVEFEDEEDPAEIKDTGVELVKSYRKNVAITIQPVEVEMKCEINIVDVAKPIIGYIDLIDDKERIIDHKTASRSPDIKKITQSIQLTSYAISYFAKYQKMPTSLVLDYLIKTKEPKIVRLEGTRNEGDIKRFVRTVKDVAKNIDDKRFHPCDPESWICSEKWCGYWKVCHEKYL